MKMFLATHNQGKYNSLANDLKKIEVDLKQLSVDFPEPRELLLEKIAALKAINGYNLLVDRGEKDFSLIAIDAGFYLDAYENFPGTFTNFILESIGLDGIIALLKEKQNRKAYFKDALAYMDSELEKPIVYTTIAQGTCSFEKRGEPKPWNWSVISQIYMRDNESHTMAEETEEEYLSHKKDESLKVKFIKKILQEKDKINLKEYDDYYVLNEL